MGKIEAAIIEAYTAYDQAIQSTLDPKAVLPYFQYPFFFLTPQAAIAAATPADVEAQLPISYADAFAVVTAQERNGVVVTGDPEFRSVETAGLVPVEWLRR
jgi:predicted nucleic acid-binding protein